MINKLFTVVAIFLSPTAGAFAQSADTTFYKDALKNTIEIYNQYVREQTNLYNGYEYVKPVQTSDEEHPFFKFDDWTTGTLEYDDELFQGISLLYDLTSDKLVTEHPVNGNALELIREKIKCFSLSEHKFERIKNETVANSLPQTGFYEILYGGATKAIAFRQKRKLETISSGSVDMSYPQKDRYYIFKSGKYFHVAGKASIFKILSDQKPALRQLLRSQKLSFYKNQESTLARLAEFYDTLKKTQ